MPHRSGSRALPQAAAVVLILVAGGIAYSNSFAGIFVFDDEPALANNPNLARLFPLADALKAPPDTTLSGRPVASLTFALDHARSGGTLEAYHATNLLIHVLAALLVFGITRRTLLTPSLARRFPGAATALALIVASLFVVHPLQTGAVTYIVQRVESLMGLLYLATLYGAIRALDASPRFGAVWTGVAVLSCALGMGVKEVMATAPLMVMLWDRQFAPERVSARRPLYALLVATWLPLAVLVAGGPRAASVGFSFEDWPWWRYLMTQAEVVTHYLRLSFYPSPLVLDYEWPAAKSLAQIAAPGALIAALLVATALGVVRRAPASFAGAWFFLILAPTSSILPIATEVAAEHRMYLPLAGVIALVVLGAFALGRRIGAILPARLSGILAPAGLLIAAVVITLFTTMTRARNLDYQDYDRIWSDTIAKRPEDGRARNNYATSLLAAGKFAEAEPHLRVAVEQKPSFAEAQANLGVALSAQGKLEEGAAHLERAVTLRPDFADAHRNLAEAYALQGRMGEAAAHYTKALETRPDDVSLLNRAAWILATASDPGVRNGARARALADRAVQITRRQDSASLDSLAASLAELGQFAEARRVLEEALSLAGSKGDSGLLRELELRAAHYARNEAFRDR